MSGVQGGAPLTIPRHIRFALLTDTNSRQNKLWLAKSWRHFRGYNIEVRWMGAPFFSRLEFSLDGEPWVAAKSYDDDVRPTLEWNRPRKIAWTTARTADR